VAWSVRQAKVRRERLCLELKELENVNIGFGRMTLIQKLMVQNLALILWVCLLWLIQKVGKLRLFQRNAIEREIKITVVNISVELTSQEFEQFLLKTEFEHNASEVREK